MMMRRRGPGLVRAGSDDGGSRRATPHGAVRRRQDQKYAAQDQAAYEDQVAQQQAAAQPAEPSYTAELEKLAQLQLQGIITQEEFEAKKSRSWASSVHRYLARLPLILLAVAALAAGCGGDSGESATTAWADDVCSAITSWTDSIASTAESLSGNLSEEELKESADELEGDTQTFVDDLRELGPPETEAGQEAQATLDELAGAVEGSISTIGDAVEDAAGAEGVLEAVSAISTAMSTLADQVAAAFTELEDLDASGELEKAFEDAESCDELSN